MFLRLDAGLLRELHTFLVQRGEREKAARLDELLRAHDGLPPIQVDDGPTTRTGHPVGRLEPIPGLELRWFSFAFQRVRVVPHRSGLDRLVVDFEVRDRDGHAPLDLIFQRGCARLDTVRPIVAQDPPARAEQVRQGLHEAICHEVDECLFWRGRRAWDPHA